jgi:PKD repeat protein
LEPLVAKINASQTSGLAPLTVNFSGTPSTTDPTCSFSSFSWDFDDGGMDSSPAPIHQFTSPGIYQVELEVEDTCAQSDTAMVTITATEPDSDGDGIPNSTDNCVNVSNASQADTDNDGQGDACDSDDDGDSIPDTNDNCPTIVNTSQSNIDGDSQGDACDPDDDNDSFPDLFDNCPQIANTDQKDSDGDQQGDVCDFDDDNDGHVDSNDNCPDIANSNQIDRDGDGQGDACDEDDDGDGISDQQEQEQGSDPLNADTDGDGVLDGMDACPLEAGQAEAHGCAVADLEIEISSADAHMAVGSEAVYGIQVNNLGPGVAHDVRIIITASFQVDGENPEAGDHAIGSLLGENWDCGSSAGVAPDGLQCTLENLEPGAAAPISAILIEAGFAGLLQISARVESDNDPNLQNNETFLTTDVGIATDLSVELAGVPERVACGEEFFVRLLVRNLGPVEARDINLSVGVVFHPSEGEADLSVPFVLESEIAGWDCNGAGCTFAGPLPSGNAPPALRVALTEERKGEMEIFAIVDTLPDRDDDGDPDRDNNRAAVLIQIVGADLELSILQGPARVAPGAPIVYILGVNNIGPAPAEDVNLVVGVVFESPDGDQDPLVPFTITSLNAGWDCGGTFCTFAGPLSSGSDAPRFRVTFMEDRSGILALGATVNTLPDREDDGDPDRSNNDVFARITIGGPDLELILLDGPQTVDLDEPIEYTFQVANLGVGVDASELLLGVTFEFEPSDGGDFVRLVPRILVEGRWVCGLLCELDILADGEIAPLIIVRLDPIDEPGWINISGRVSLAEVDPNPANNLLNIDQQTQIN